MPTVHIAGNPTAAEKDENKCSETGWGEKISTYFLPEIQINNQTKNGRNTKILIQEGRLSRLASQFQPNDFLFIQFGYNDQKIQEERGTLPFGSYLKNLQMFSGCTKKVNVHIVLLTSATRRDYLEDGALNPDISGGYPRAMCVFTKKHHIPLLDVLSRLQEYSQIFPKEETRKLYSYLMSNSCKNCPEELKDNTHFSPEGTDKVARMTAELIKESRLPLADYLQRGV